MQRLELPERPRILVITLRRLGDVLLTTPLVRALRTALPQARIDMLVFRGTEGILSGNPDIADIVTVPVAPRLADTVAMLRRLWRRYDLAISTQPGDRPTIAALLAGRRQIGLVPQRGNGRWWKTPLLTAPIVAEPGNHRVLELLRLVAPLGIAERPDQVPPRGDAPVGAFPPRPYAVLHANPMYRYKRWTDAGWRALAAALAARGLSIVATGGPAEEERAYLDRLWGAASVPVLRLDGRLSWPELVALVQDASVFVGTDTSMTHLAAAAGCPTIALFGPTSPALIGPWPVGGLTRVWDAVGTIQRRGNVWTVQHPLPCLPCERLGCEGHLDSRAHCLDALDVNEVLAAVDAALTERRATPPAVPAS